MSRLKEGQQKVSLIYRNLIHKVTKISCNELLLHRLKHKNKKTFESMLLRHQALKIATNLYTALLLKVFQ